MGKNELPWVLPYNKNDVQSPPYCCISAGNEASARQRKLVCKSPPTNKRTCQLAWPQRSGHPQAEAYRALLLNSGRTVNFYTLSGKNIFKQTAV